MGEFTLEIISFLRLAWVCGYSFFYGLGGTAGYGKWIRRYFGSAYLLLGIFIFSTWLHTWNFWYLLYFPLLVLSSSIGYGADNQSTKILKRTIQGLLFGISALPMAITNHAWVLFSIHIFVCVLFCVTLGVLNPTKSARSEESLIGFSISLIPMFIIGG